MVVIKKESPAIGGAPDDTVLVPVGFRVSFKRLYELRVRLSDVLRLMLTR